MNTNCGILLTYHQILKTTVYKECIRINDYKWFFSVIFNWLIEWIFFFYLMLGQGKQSRSVRPWRKFKAISGIITKDGFYS